MKVSAQTLLLLRLLATVITSDAATDSQESDAPVGAITPRLHRDLQAPLVTVAPVQTYMIPLRETELIKSFNSVDPTTLLTDSVVSLTSISIAAGGTVLWYDHWEDGYEIDITAPAQSSTKVWGDGDWSNGCVEKIRQLTVGNSAYVCTSSDSDVIRAGEALLLRNIVPTAGRLASAVFYDGGDVLRSSFPVSLARAGYPDNAAAGLLAGAVEMVEFKNWGTSFSAPVGVDTTTVQRAFSVSEIFIMASLDGTVVSKNGVVQTTLDQGEEYVLRDVRMSDSIVTSEIAQANLLTGEKVSTYEMRWYSLLPTSQWYNDYYTPVHRTEIASFNVDPIEHKVVLYNPGTGSITVQHYVQGATGGRTLYGTYTVGASSNAFSNDLPNDKGSQFVSADPSQVFYAFTLTDWSTSINSMTGDNEGRISDWGHPLIPANKLTSQALIGLGWGCVDNDCDTEVARSVVWVTPTVSADIYVDFNGDGVADAPYAPMYLAELHAITIVDGDKDMTGAIVWATKPGEPNNNEGVSIAVAWGQDPKRARQGTERYSLDMGTVVMPLPETSATKTVAHAPGGDVDGDNGYSVGDILRYTIRVTNTGRLMIPQGAIEIVDDAAPIFDQTTYVPATTTYTRQDASGVPMPTLGVADDVSPETPFPLDGTGLVSQADLYVGTAHQLTFEVEIKSIEEITSDKVINVGHMKHNGVIKDTFEVTTPLSFTPSIDIQTTVYPDRGGGSCPGAETLTDVMNTLITYCYVITNTGNTYLDLMTLSDDIGSDLSPQLDGQLLVPGESITLSSPDVLLEDFTDTGVVVGNPSLSNGFDLVLLDDVTDSDPANVIMALSAPPTPAPTGAPIAASAPPTIAPVKADHILTGDLCKSFQASFDTNKVLEQFAFVARTNECVRVQAFVSEVPPTPDELADCCSGVLGSHWTKACDGYVIGMGDLQNTYIDEDDCAGYFAEANTTLYFHFNMEYVDESTYCTGSGSIMSRFEMVKSVERSENLDCSVP